MTLPACSPEFPVDTETGNYFIANYPPFSQWQADQVPALERALQRPASQDDLALYVHVPFCRQRCSYCYFRTHVRQSDQIDRYVEAVLREAELYAALPAVGSRRIGNAYFGGGTPSLLSVEQMQRLIEGLRARLNWGRDVPEVTYECQPGTLSPEKLAALAGLGVNRASLGVQTFTEDVLRRMGRLATADDCRHAYRMAREAGFQQVNMDLIAGLPGETESSWMATVDEAIRLNPNSLTIYQLELTHNSVMNRLLREGRPTTLPNWPEKRRWVAAAFDRLREKGYTIFSAYWAVRDPSRPQYAYVTEYFWHGRDLLALGETSFGYFRGGQGADEGAAGEGGFHYQNVDDLQPYLAAIDAGRLPLGRVYPLSLEEELRRQLILQLKTGSVRLDEFSRKFGVDLREHFAERLQVLGRQGLLESDDGAIRLTSEGLLRADWLLSQFYLPQHVDVRYT